MAQARVRQINISPGGVPKTPVSRAHVGPLGLVGDGHRHHSHGGSQKALLLIAAEVVDSLVSEGWPLFYGALGENFTTVGLEHRSWRPGQRYRVGDVVVELTTPRQPCSVLNCYGRGIQKRIYDSQVEALDSSSERWGESGFYASVVQPGTVETDAIIVVGE